MPDRYLLRLACCLLPATSWLSGLSQPLPDRPGPLPDRLLSLAAPPELRASTQRILAAVYPFQITSDQQVQDRNQPQATLASRYTDVLFRTLQSSGWFMPVEPGNMGNLLNGQAAAPTGSTVALAGTNTAPPRDKPTLVLEAGLFAHDTRHVPGEVGRAYFGGDGEGPYRLDRATVYLRVISAQSGKILSTVYWTKTLLSQPTANQLYRYVVLDRFLGNTPGNTRLSPDHFVLAETIKDVVRGLIIEGVRDGLWTGGDLSAPQLARVVSAYEAEKNTLTDAQQVSLEPLRGASRRHPPLQPRPVSVCLYGGGLRYHGDYADRATNGTYGLSVDAYANPYLGLQLALASGTLSSQNAFRTRLSSAEVNVLVKPFPYHHLTPLVFGGIGVVGRSGSNPFALAGKAYVQYQVGGGVQYSLTDRLGFRALLAYNLPGTDLLDGRQRGNHNDFYVRTTLGLLVHLGPPRAK